MVLPFVLLGDRLTKLHFKLLEQVAQCETKLQLREATQSVTHPDTIGGKYLIPMHALVPRLYGFKYRSPSHLPPSHRSGRNSWGLGKTASLSCRDWCAAETMV